MHLSQAAFVSELGLIILAEKKKMGKDTKKQKPSFRHFNNEKYQPI